MEIRINKSKDLNTKQHFKFIYKLPETLLASFAQTETGEATISGTYELESDQTVKLVAQIVVPMRWICDRCGDNFNKNFFIEIDETIYPTSNEDNYSYESNIIELENIVNDQILLNMPSKVLCREDCKGICNICGQNLNYGKCDCNKEKQNNSPFAQIKNQLN